MPEAGSFYRLIHEIVYIAIKYGGINVKSVCGY